MKILQNIAGIKSRQCTPEDIKKVVVPLVAPMTKLCYQPLENHKTGALALAHCQVEAVDPLRFFVLKDGVAIVNPVIHKRCGQPFRNLEGCMSLAHLAMPLGVMRHRKLIVSFTVVDEDGQTEDGENVEVDGDTALIFQHEIDHFNGKMIL